MKSVLFPLALPLLTLAQTEYITINQFVDSINGQGAPATTTMTEATLVPLGTGNQETTYLYVLNGTQMDITLEATLVASASGHRIIATDYPQECHWTASDSGECLLEAVQDGTTEPISTMVGTPIEIVLPVSATAVELGGSDSVSTSTPTSSGTQGSSGGTQTTPTGSGGGSATTQSPGSNGTVSRSIASSVLVALALMLSGAFAGAGLVL